MAKSDRFASLALKSLMTVNPFDAPTFVRITFLPMLIERNDNLVPSWPFAFDAKYLDYLIFTLVLDDFCGQHKVLLLSEVGTVEPRKQMR